MPQILKKIRKLTNDSRELIVNLSVDENAIWSGVQSRLETYRTIEKKRDELYDYFQSKGVGGNVAINLVINNFCELGESVYRAGLLMDEMIIIKNENYFKKSTNLADILIIDLGKIINAR